MAKSKKNDKASAAPSVKVEDLAPEKDPKGGSLNYAKMDVGYKMAKMAKMEPALKIDTSLASIDTAIKLHK